MNVYIKCTACGKDFRISPSRLDTALFCSRKCYSDNAHLRRGSSSDTARIASRDMIGQKFGRLTIMSVDKGSLVCACDCGTSGSRFFKNALIGGRVKSCGCYNREKHRKPGQDGAHGAWFSYLKDAAKLKEREFCLTADDARRLCSLPCQYCGIEAQPWLGAKKMYLTSAASKRTRVPDTAFADSKIISVNGLDRVDSTRGYTLDNVVPCCRTCNTAKLDMTVADFSAWVTRVYRHIGNKDNK